MLRTSPLIDLHDSRIGVLICGHGSRNASAIKEFASLVNQIKTKLPGVPVEYGYLEFAQPVIVKALDRLRDQSVNKVIAIPAMLFAAGHAKNDIPSILKKYSKDTGLVIDYGRELGINSLMIGAAGERVKEAINLRPKTSPFETLLVVVGRGSSDPDANSNVSKITRMLVEGLGLGWGETFFSGVTFPLVQPGLRHVVRLGFKKIIIFPYFLFSGVLVDRILEHTQLVADENPNVQFVNAGYMSDHPLVIRTFMERINEVLHGDNSMNCALCKYRSDLLGFEEEVGTVQQSHHHHVEGIIKDCPFCEEGSTCICEKDTQKLVENNSEIIDHFHRPPYPHSDHPMGPVTLRP